VGSVGFPIDLDQIWVPPSKGAVSATVDQFSKRTVADRHIIIIIIIIIEFV